MYAFRIFSVCLLVGGLHALASASTYTSVNDPRPGELSHEEILEGIYGGDFSIFGGGWTNGGIDVWRVFDGDGLSALKLINPDLLTQEDSLQDDGFIEAVAHARYAKDMQHIGYVPGPHDPLDPDLNDDFVEMFTIVGSGFGVSGDWTGDIDGLFRWARRTKTSGDHLFTADPLDNLDPLGEPHDQLVTYLVNNGEPGVTWLLFWEDRIEGDSSFDYDFNDAVIELTVTPEPGSLALLALGGLPALFRRPRG